MLCPSLWIALVSAGMGVSLSPLLRIEAKGVEFRELIDCKVAVEGGIAYRRDEKSEVLPKILPIAPIPTLLLAFRLIGFSRVLHVRW